MNEEGSKKRCFTKYQLLSLRQICINATKLIVKISALRFKKVNVLEHSSSFIVMQMQPAKQCVLSGPTILKCDPSEVVDKFWCPFCLAEVKKHERSGQIIAQFKSWAEHLCRSVLLV